MPIPLFEAAVWYVVFLISVTAHEAAHAAAALRGGDPTAYAGGQVSLDPRPHIQRSPFGMVLLPLMSLSALGWPLGYASAPYDAAWAHRFPRRAAWMALAGPAANFAIAVAAGLAFSLGEAAGVFERVASPRVDAIAAAALPGAWEGIGFGLSVLFSMNLILFAFNMLPVPPLDGAAVTGLFVSEETSRRLQRLLYQPMLQMAGLAAAWFFFGPLFRSLFAIALNLIFPGSDYAVR